MKFYDGTKVMSLPDENGNKPELILVETNRTAGKTTFYSRYFVKRFLNNGEKFCILYRFKNELSDVHNKFFKDIKSLFFPAYEMASKKIAGGAIIELSIGKDGKFKECGYAVAINSADSVKKCSHLLSDVQRILFDEFQSENEFYCQNEINKFISVHNSIARGGGKQSRYVPVYMLSNSVSILNPYYVALGISQRLTKDTKYLKGNGFVLERIVVYSALKASQNSIFNKAFSNSYVDYNEGAKYLNDNSTFIEKIEKGKSKYICTFIYNSSKFGIREMTDNNLLYVSSKIDPSFKTVIAVTPGDHNQNNVLVTEHRIIISVLKSFFNRGKFRFEDLLCKNATLALLS